MIHTSNLLDSIPAGKYYLLVTDLLGCTKTDSITLADPPGMTLAGSQVSESNDGNYQISCNGAADGYIKLNISGGSGTYIFLWVGPDSYTSGTKDISGLKAGTYTCTVTDINGCILVPQPVFTLSEPDILAISSVKSISADGAFNISCNGGTGSIDAAVTGGSIGNYTYAWSTTNGSGIVVGQLDQNALTAGTYHLLVTDINGCIAQADITLTEPQALSAVLVSSHITCQSPGFNNGSINLTVKGGIEPYSYAWSTGQTVQDILGLTEGYYRVTVTDANGCTITDSAHVDLPPLLTYTQALSQFNTYNISCNGASDGSIGITMTSGQAPYSYSWQGPGGFSASTEDLSGLKAGKYTLVITDSNLCTMEDTINMTEPGKLTMTVSTSASLTGDYNLNCAGEKTGSIEVEAVNNAGPVDYLWADGTIGNSRSDLKAGQYRILIADSNNCTADSTITLTEPDSIKLSFEVTQPLCKDLPNGEITLNVTGGTSPSYTYLWSDNSTSKDVTSAVSGLYTVTVTDLNDCKATGSVMVTTLKDICLEIPNAITPNGDLINDVWNIGLRDLYPQMEVKIFNRWGELVWKSEKGYPQPWDGRSNGTLLPFDSYHYIIDLHNGSRLLIGTITIVK